MPPDLLDVLQTQGTPADDAPEPPTTPPADPPAQGAGPVDAAQVGRVRTTRKSGHGGARPGAGRKRKPVDATPAPAPAQVDIAPLMPVVVDTYALVLSIIAVARVTFDDGERPAVTAGLLYCINTYLPPGYAKHAPVFLLAAVSAKAVARAREAKRAAARESESAGDGGPTP